MSPSNIALLFQVMDLFLVPCYLILSLAAVATSNVPILRDLARHGKMTLNSSSNSTTGEKTHANQWMMVDKRYFSHFYIVGFICACIVASMGLGTYVRRAEISSNIAFGLLILHVLRRLFECFYIHEWGGSQMHVAGYLLGLFHYLILPFVFVSVPDCDGVLSDETSTDEQHFIFRPQAIIWVVLCLYAQMQQYRHHQLLAKVRQRGYEQRKKRAVPGSAATESIHKYHIPRGGLFQYISCPHYLAEILIYASLLLLRSTDSRSLLPVECADGPSLFLIEPRREALDSLKAWKAESLLLWVTTNLSVSAWNCHLWYQNTFQDSYPHHRKALIPFVW